MEETYEGSIFEEEIQVIYGGFWERFGALFLDAIILAPVTVLNYYSENRWGNIWLMLLCAIVSLVYKPFLEYRFGATPGKKALSLKVVNRTYGNLSAGEAILRNIFGLAVGIVSLIISFYTISHAPEGMRPVVNINDIDSNELITSMLFGGGVFVLYLADAICLVANNKKQSLHDLIAGTYVIRQ